MNAYNDILRRAILLIAFLCFVELCHSQQVPTQQLKKIENEIRRNRDKDKTLLIDGPIEPEKWYDKNKRKHPSDFRIVFLLKEAYGADNQGVLRLDSLQRYYHSLQDIKEGLQTYAPMVAIANMLVLNKSYDEVQLQRNSTDAYTIFKECSAIVEAKKEYGTPESRDGNIKVHARRNKKIIEKQIEVYNPNVVILCGNNIYDGIFITHDVLGHKAFGVPANNVRQLSENSKFSYYYDDNYNCIYINTYHPSSTIKKKNDYCTEIVEAVRQWMEEKEK